MLGQRSTAEQDDEQTPVLNKNPACLKGFEI